ncbi:MAG: hypothetical protein IKM31_07180, partial [Oscillospiraceae bacterium]|nr:hypothetical protein [Oscillospiraceae bacterium]
FPSQVRSAFGLSFGNIFRSERPNFPYGKTIFPSQVRSAFGLSFGNIFRSERPNFPYGKTIFPSQVRSAFRLSFGPAADAEEYSGKTAVVFEDSEGTFFQKVPSAGFGAAPRQAAPRQIKPQ